MPDTCLWFDFCWLDDCIEKEILLPFRNVSRLELEMLSVLVLQLFNDENYLFMFDKLPLLASVIRHCSPRVSFDCLYIKASMLKPFSCNSSIVFISILLLVSLPRALARRSLQWRQRGHVKRGWCRYRKTKTRWWGISQNSLLHPPPDQSQGRSPRRKR